MYLEYPEEFVGELHVPGKFVKKSETRIPIDKGRSIEMDSSYVADPDYEIIHEPVVVNIEHQSSPVTLSKIKTITDYKIHQTHIEKLPTLSVIATNTDKDKSVQIYKRTPSEVTELYFIDLTEKSIWERLNKVTSIINSNKEVSVNDVLNLGIIALFAPKKHAKEITKEVVELYAKLNTLPPKLEKTIYPVLCEMADAYFDDETEYQKVMNMLNEKTTKETQDKTEYAKKLEKDIELTKRENEYVNGKNKELINEKNELNNKNHELTNKNHNLINEKNELNNKNHELIDEVSALKERVKFLENQLANSK